MLKLSMDQRFGTKTVWMGSMKPFLGERMIRCQHEKIAPDSATVRSVSEYLKRSCGAIFLPFAVVTLGFLATDLTAVGSCLESVRQLEGSQKPAVSSLPDATSRRAPVTFAEFLASRNNWEALVKRQHDQLRQLSRRMDDGKPVLFIVVPSLNFDPAEIGPIIGAAHYEQRSLWTLLRAADSNVRVLFVSSSEVPQTALEELFSGLSQSEIDEIRSRSKMIALNDTRTEYLSDKIANSSEALTRIQLASRELLDGQEPTGANAVLSGFVNESSMDRLSAKLQLPLAGMHPGLEILNSKMGNRIVARESEIPFAAGTDSNYKVSEIADSIDRLYVQMGGRGSCFIKANYGASGQGIIKIEFRNSADTSSAQRNDSNIVLELASDETEDNRRKLILELLWDHSEKNPQLKNVLSRAEEFGVVVESGIEHTRAPSVQLEILANGEVIPISTHMQDMDGPVYKGAAQPAYGDIELEAKLMGYAVKYAKTLFGYGVVGRIGLDFFEVKNDSEIDFVFGEANIREGGTTHPWEIVARLLRAKFDDATKSFVSSETGKPVFYKMTDNFVDRESFQNLSLHDLWEEFRNDPEYSSLKPNKQTGTGVKFHLLSALPEFGKVGLTAFAGSKQEAEDLFRKAKEVLVRSANRLREKAAN